ncbi:PASTA domain-containing protein [Sphingobacterium sp. SGG-5]|uniref:PASTA domain-containing protein n=1 Tax=Sphingobacterium sp. SGG-5 TaxID=2710881 RepID=UPI0013EC3B75|nr:PASTA domain-containing protein [Sphingobacterium sp. SGG-5]NGM62998.1 PASTA domain-containing protein [Sphingobacterium sp. SGG-5]
MSKLLLYLRTDTFRKNLIYALIFFGVLFLLIYFGLRMYTKHGDSQEVPVLKGLTIGQAVQVLDKAGLEYEVDSVYQLDAKPGLVIEQDPEAKAPVKSGRTIYLTIITQVAPEIAFPDIMEKNLVEATAILKNHALKIGDTVYVNDIARDVVLDVQFAGQPLKAGRMLSKGSRVTLVLGNGRGANEVEVPNVLGLTLSEAKFAIQGLGLNLGSVSGVILDTLSARVVAQSPDTSARIISIGTPINLTLSNE